MKPFPILLLILLVPLAFAAIPSCILKVRILSPDNGYSLPVVASGAPNLFVSANITNISGDAPIAADALFRFDNGTDVVLSPSAIGNYSLAIGDYRDGSHSFTILANASGCISDSVTQQYYYRSSAIRNVPEFNPILAPFVGFAAIFAARAYGRKKAKK
jgi:hypothetical protein